MEINSNEEYCPIEALDFMKVPYYLVSCKSSDQEFCCIAESDQDVVRFLFHSHIAFRITNSSFRDYDMRNRFCDHVLYIIKNSYYHNELERSNFRNIKDWNHYLISLDDNIIDIIAGGAITVSYSKCMDEKERNISERKEDFLGTKELFLAPAKHLPYVNFDNITFNQHKEILIPIGDVLGNFKLLQSDYGAIDLRILIESTKKSNSKITIIFPEIICYKESTRKEEMSSKLSSENELNRTSVMFDIYNSNYKVWLAYAGYSQLYGLPINIRHIRVVLSNRIFDILLPKYKYPII